MTTSYLVVTPPGGADPNHEKTRFIRDGFTWLGFLFPWIWLAYHRLWLAAAAAFLAQILSRVLMTRPDLWSAGVALALASMLLVGFEGMNWRAAKLLRDGWQQAAIVAASSLRTAEEIFFADREISKDMPEYRPFTAFDQRAGDRDDGRDAGGGTTSLDLFGFPGGR